MQGPARWRRHLYGELLLFLALTFALFVFLYSIALYRKLTLDDSLVTIQYGYLAIQSIVLAKIIILGKFLRLGERFAERSLIIPAFYKTVVFSAFVFAFAYFEHVLRGAFSGESLSELYLDWSKTNIIPVLGRIPIVLFVAFPFCCLVEIGNLIGKERLYDLFFQRRKKLRDEMRKTLH